MIVAGIDFSPDIVAIVGMKDIPECIASLFDPSPVGHCVLILKGLVVILCKPTLKELSHGLHILKSLA